MPRDITVTFDDGSAHTYSGAPDNVTPEQITQRAQSDFSGKKVSHLDGGKKADAAPKEEKKSGVMSAREIAESIMPGAAATLSVASSMIAKPVSDIAGLAATGVEMATGGENPSGPTGFKKEVEDMLSYKPKAGLASGLTSVAAVPGKAVGAVTGPIGNAVRGDGKNPYRDAAGNAIEEGLNQAANILGAKYAPEIAKAGGKITQPILDQAAKLPGKIGDAAKTLSGAKASAAKEAALTSARDNLTEAQKKTATTAQQEETRAKAQDSVRAGLDKKLAESRNIVPDLAKQGDTLREAYGNSMKAASDARAEAANTDFKTALEAATKKEAEGTAASKNADWRFMEGATGKSPAGKRIDTSPIIDKLNSMLADSRGLPGVEGKLKEIMSSIKTDAGAPGKTFTQLEMTRRYLNDVAYSGNFEGYSAIIRNQAKDLAKMLDMKMQDFVPEFKAYKERYAQNSEALHSLDTRFGKAVSQTEGGLKGDAYDKVASQDLPGRMFSKREGVDLMTDALAGGKLPAKPTPQQLQAREHATRQVNDMMESWIMEKTRPESATQAAKTLQSPQMRSALSAAPDVQSRLSSKFKDNASIESTTKQVAQQVEEARTRSRKAAQASQQIKTDIAMADELYANKDTVSQKRAFNAYRNALDRERASGQITPEKYKATLELMSRATNEAEKVARLRKIVSWAVGGTVALGAEESARRLMK